jgi:hypothetical protein
MWPISQSAYWPHAFSQRAQLAVVMEIGQRVVGRRNMGAPIPNTLGTL